MAGSSDPRVQGPAAVFDRAVHLFSRAPALWLGRGVLPSVPFALGMFAAVYLYVSIWSYEAWDLGLLFRSFVVAGGLVLAWAFRGFAQAALFREAFSQADASSSFVRVKREGDFPLPRRRASAAGMLSVGGSLMLLPLCVLPGVFFGASTLALGPVIAAEDRDLGSALRRTLRLARHHPLRGLTTLLFFGGVHLLLWLSVLLSCRGGVVLISALFGVDLSAAELVFSPSNVSFLLGSAVCAWLLLEPLWVLQRALLYLDSALGVSGADLREAWEAIKVGSTHPQGPEGAAHGKGLGATVGSALAALSLVLLGCSGHALAQAADSSVEDSTPQQLVTYAAGVEAMADAVAALTPDDSAPTMPGEDGELHIDREVLRELLGREGVLSVVLPGGVEVRLDPSAAVPPGAEGMSPDVSRASVVVLTERLREAGALARELASPGVPTTDLLGGGASGRVDIANSGAPVRAPGPDLRTMLAEELKRDGYSLAVRVREHRGDETPFLERFFEWLEAWFEGYEQEESAPYGGPSVRLPTKAVVVSALMALSIVAVLWGWAARGRGESGDRSSEQRSRDSGTPSLPDARSRSVESWRTLAERSALSGDHREAIRSLFLAVLAMLEGLREIEYRPSSSNGEHLATFSGASSRRDNFALAVLSFEIAWFGGQGAQAIDWERMLRLCAPLLRTCDTAQGSDG